MKYIIKRYFTKGPAKKLNIYMHDLYDYEKTGGTKPRCDIETKRLIHKLFYTAVDKKQGLGYARDYL